MNLGLIYHISKSLLLARWRQTMVAAFGVTFSITMFIALLGFMNGLNDLLDGLILNRTPHVRIFKEIKPNEQQPVSLWNEFRGHHHFIHSLKAGNSRVELTNTGSILKALSQDSRVLGYSPKIVAQVFFNDGSNDITGVLNGIMVEEESRLFNFSDYVTYGNPVDIKNVQNSIILGKGLADKMSVEIGETVYVSVPRGGQVPLKVVGFFQSGLMDIDKIQSFTSLTTARKLTGKGSNNLTDIQVKLKNMDLAPAMAKEYRALFRVDAEDIQTANAQFETGSFVRTLISYAVGITLLIVAGFGIYNILNMMIYEKMDSIAILKATGFSGRDVKSIFILIAVSIGTFGGILGLIFGFLSSAGIDQIPFKTQSLPTITTYPVNYDLKFYVTGISFALITTFFAGYFPARKASKIDPVIIIRGK